MRRPLTPMQIAVIDSLILHLGHLYSSSFGELQQRPSDDGLVAFINETSLLMQGLERYKRNFPLVTQGTLL